MAEDAFCAWLSAIAPLEDATSPDDVADFFDTVPGLTVDRETSGPVDPDDEDLSIWPDDATVPFRLYIHVDGPDREVAMLFVVPAEVVS